MASEMFMFDNSFFSDPFEILQEIQEHNNPFDEIEATLFSSSPPSVQLENLTISHLENTEYSAFEVKTEEFQLNPDGFSTYVDSFLPHSFDAAHETAVKLMQRSYSSNSFEKKQNCSFRPQFDSVFESHHLENPENSFSSTSSGHMRRVCSTGDLQKVKINMQTRNVTSSNPLSAEKTLLIEEANFKVGKYSAEERKERIDRYRAKRGQRNFNRTIKYACRKTLADNRPRIRGRFARNDEAGEIPKASTFHRYEDEDDLWIDGFQGERDKGIAQKGLFFNSFGPTQYTNYSY